MSGSVEARKGASGAAAPEEDPARFYEIHQEWPDEVKRGIAEYLRSNLASAAPRACLFFGAATGVNDVLPFARVADPRDRIVGSDVVEAYLDRLRAQAQREGLSNLQARAIDVRMDLPEQGSFDLVSLFFVIHRLDDWRSVVPSLAKIVGHGGSLYVSEFVGPSGIIYLSNEAGGAGQDPVSRMIRRHFELLQEPFAPALRSTSISPVRERLAEFLRPAGSRDFVWPQRLSVGDMYRKIASRAYAPYFSTQATEELLARLRHEFGSEWSHEVAFQETIRVYRFVRSG